MSDFFKISFYIWLFWLIPAIAYNFYNQNLFNVKNQFAVETKKDPEPETGPQSQPEVPKNNKAILILLVNTPRGTIMEKIPNYETMEDCGKAGATSRTRWYGEAVPKDLSAAYSCVPGPDSFGERK